MSKQKVVSSLLLSTVVLGGLAFYSTTTVKAESLESDVTSVSSSDVVEKPVVSNEEGGDFLAEEELEESDAPVETLNEEIKDVTEPESVLRPRAMRSVSETSDMEKIPVGDSVSVSEKVVKQQSDLIQTSNADTRSGADQEKLRTSVSIESLQAEKNKIKWQVTFDTSAWSFNYYHGGVYFVLPKGLDLESIKDNTNNELFSRFPTKVDSPDNGDSAPHRFFNEEENSDSFNNQWGWSAGQANPNDTIKRWKEEHRFSKIYFINQIKDTTPVTYTLTASITDSNQKSFPLAAVMKSFGYKNHSNTEYTSLGAREITLVTPKETPMPPKEAPKQEEPKQDAPETPDKQPEEMPKVPEAPKEDAPQTPQEPQEQPKETPEVSPKPEAPEEPSIPEEQPKETPKPEVPSTPDKQPEAPTEEPKQDAPQTPQAPSTPEKQPEAPEAPKEEAPKEEVPAPEVPSVPEEKPMEEPKPEAPKEDTPASPAPSVPEEQPKETPKPEVPSTPEKQPEAPKEEPKQDAPQTPSTPKEEAPKEEVPAPEVPSVPEEKPMEEPKPEAPKAEQPQMDKPQMEAPKKDSEAPKTGKAESDKPMPEPKQPDMKQPKTDDMPKEQKPKADEPKAEQPQMDKPQMEAPKKDSEAPKSDKVETDKPMPETKKPDMKQPKADKPEAEKAQMPRTEGMKPESKASMMPKPEAPKATLPNTGEASSAIGWLGGALATLATGLYLFKNKKEE
ncbi:TPA: LPXTG cell wall anchor domain-containing protein [Streptococcus suis]|nr:LPXTG cell wall anchor domain-containing protein [Streptococcus suis]